MRQNFCFEPNKVFADKKNAMVVNCWFNLVFLPSTIHILLICEAIHLFGDMSIFLSSLRFPASHDNNQQIMKTHSLK